MADKRIEVHHDHQNSAQIKNLPAPVAGGDATNKTYVDGLVTSVQEGLAWKDNVRVASTGNVTIATAPAAIDGVTLSAADRVLLKNQSTASENGLYDFNGTGNALTRSADADTGPSLVNAVVSVDEGTANAQTTWRQTATNITIGVTAIAWTAFGAAVPTATTALEGKARLALDADIIAGTGGAIIVTPDKVGRTMAVAVGDGAGLTFNITHAWGTRRVAVEVTVNSVDYETVDCDVRRPSDNAVQLVFLNAPALNARAALLREIKF